MSKRNAVRFAVVILAAGCGHLARFYPAPEQGALVISDRTYGVATRVIEDEPEAAQAQGYVVLSVPQAHSACARDGICRTIVQVSVDAVNATRSEMRFFSDRIRLQIGGRSFRYGWRSRWPAVPDADFDLIGSGERVRYEFSFDLGPYPRQLGLELMAAPPVEAGIPLASIRDLQIDWVAEWDDSLTSRSIVFVRERPEAYQGAYLRAPSTFYWGWGWSVWPDSGFHGGFVVPYGAYWP